MKQNSESFDKNAQRKLILVNNFDHQQLEEKVFLRNDVNQMFDSMMISTNFNLKKYNHDKELQTKKSTDRQTFDNKMQILSNKKIRKNVTETVDDEHLNDEIMASDKKIGVKRYQNDVKQPERKKSFLNTDNLNKLLKKKQSFSFTNTSGFNGTKTMTNNFQSTITNTSNKNEQNQALFSSTKYPGPETGKMTEPKNVRKKIMSMTSKGIRVQKIAKETSYQNETAPISFKRKQRMQTENTLQGRNGKMGTQKKQNKYEQLQKRYNRGGPLKFKHVQNWLNNIIQEYCHDQYFDTSLTSSALKKYYIDSNSLMSNGVQPNDVNRIYNSLFVYSIGFNNLIKQISKGNRQLVKNIWKVYSLLLQYCAAGNYQTMIGEIQRDKLRKVEQLKVQIQKRQQVIEKNEEINENKNLTMYKQLKRLKDQNLNLANERQILMEDFQQADQAFNEEVTLRLKFQNTINEIYGVHKELSNKHGRLFHDFQIKIQQLKRSSQKYFEQTKTSQKYKYELIDLKQRYNEMNKINNHDKEHIEVLLQDSYKMRETHFQTLKELQQTKYINVEKARKLDQIQMELKNNKVILQLRQKSAKQTHHQYQITLEENNKLFMVISDQRQQMQGLIKEKKQFNQNVLKILADSSYYKKKMEGTQSQMKGLKQNVLRLETSLHKSEVQNQIHNKELQSVRKDLQSNYQNIRKMHEKNFQLQEQLQFLRKYEGNMGSVIQQKNILIKNLRGKVDELEKNLMQETHDYRSLESKYKILEIQFRAQKQSNFKRLQDVKRQHQKMTINQNSLSKLLTNTQNQLQKFKGLFNNALMDFKNQKFQRGNLTLAYEQILKVLQKKNAQEKQMSIKINQLQEQVNKYKEKYKLTYLNLVNTTEQMTLKIAHLKEKIQSMQAVLNYKAHHEHPMIYEDLVHQHQREVQNHLNTKKNMQKARKTAVTQKSQLQKTLKRMKADNQSQMQKSEKRMTKMEEKFKQQLEYERQTNQKLSKKLSGLQILQATYKQKVKYFQQKQEVLQNQNRLVNQIQQKNQKIRTLYAQIQKIHDLKTNQIQAMTKRIQEAQNQKMNFVYEFKTKKQREMKEELDKKYQEEIEKAKKEYQDRLRSGRSKMTMPIPTKASQNQADGAFQIYFKELIKNKTLQEILKIKKQQFESFDQTENKSFYDQIQNFFRRSANRQNIQLFNRTNYFQSSKGSTQKDFAKSSLKVGKGKVPSYLHKIQIASEDIQKRNSISRKLKMAYEYYNKEGSMAK